MLYIGDMEKILAKVNCNGLRPPRESETHFSLLKKKQKKLSKTKAKGKYYFLWIRKEMKKIIAFF